MRMGGQSREEVSLYLHLGPILGQFSGCGIIEGFSYNGYVHGDRKV
jgi:hypothetical protein